jgi:hypothetical protein
MDYAVPGDTIILEKGRYTVNIDFQGKKITVQSKNPDDIHTVRSTIVSGTGTGPVVSYNGTEDATCSLKGITISKETDSSLVLYYKANDADDDTAIADASIYRNNGTKYGTGITSEEGKYDNAWCFDGGSHSNSCES